MLQVKCYNCKKKVHIVRDCPDPPSVSSRTRHEVKKLEELPTKEKGKEVPIIQDIIKKPAKFPYHQVRVIGGDVQGDVTALVDTGSVTIECHTSGARKALSTRRS